VGDWVFVAWEAPKALIPHGRLWVSDAGRAAPLRARAHEAGRDPAEK
jgi:hypothetical protein